ncbi:MAG: aspartate carbamoyltransferase regulatory subunit [Bacteroidales bacterium]|nr:aspartate carbamoyltransferase regulatory subunit [Bacteroidales bacterium]
MKEELIVKAIENGTVIDHIQADKLYKILSIIKIEEIDTPVFFGCNLPSKKYGKKAIIKIADKFPNDDDANKIALIDPNAVINIIRDFKVVEKRQVSLPEKVEGIVKCFNPKCITNHDKVVQKFSLVRKDGKIGLKCHYCEKITWEDNMEIK